MSRPGRGCASHRRTGERHANLREFWSVAAGVLHVGSCRLHDPGRVGGPHAGGSSCSSNPSRLRARVSGGCLRSAICHGASLLWILTSFYSIGYMRSLKEHAQTRYFACFALALSATVGVAFSANLFTLFLFYEALTLVTYPLVGHHETPEAKAGARKYIIYLLGAAKLFLVAAIILTYNVVGTLEFRAGGIHCRQRQHRAIIDAALLSCSSPCSCSDLRRTRSCRCTVGCRLPWWPPRRSAHLLHAVAVVKTGVFCTLRVFLFVFGPVAMRRSTRTNPGARRRLGDDRGRVAVGAWTGQPQGPAGLLHGEPALLHHPGSGALESERRDGWDRPHHQPRRIEDHALPMRRFNLRIRAQDRNQPDVRPGQAHAVDDGRICACLPERDRHSGTSGCISKWFLALGSANSERLAVRQCC